MGWGQRPSESSQPTSTDLPFAPYYFPYVVMNANGSLTGYFDWRPKDANEAMLTLMRHGWGQENPTFRQLFTSQFIPGGTKELADWFNELQRISTSPADAVRNFIAAGDTDVSALLSQVTVPTLVMHAREDGRVPFEQGRRLAAGIPGARFVSLPSRNHLILENEPAFQRFLQELRAFLAS